MGRMQQTYAMVDESTDTGNGHGQSSSPVISRGKNLEFMPFDPMDSTPPPKSAGVDEVEYSSEVDEEFLQNVVQEGELERLTKLAVEETEVAWKVEIMGELRKHVDGLAEDEWMYEY
ncbi:hypothetical protein H4R26_005923 [Coemansia thaxteri]|uniref:Uncharacterized protein n=1 Tax=Coemansia thaxteri TaxID=2663907 RepID=A0A9W8B8F1_9FUNG|nr:hypothetical protein H4R26_005923 [Coemansia thaxteri]